MKNITLFFFVKLALVCFLFSCSKSKKQVQTVAVQAQTPKLLFINYKIKEDAEGVLKVKMINKIIAEGSLKSARAQETVGGKGDLRCIQADDKSTTLSEEYIPNPLIKTVEYADDSGRFIKKDIILDSAEFSVRLQLDENAKFVIIEDYNSRVSLSKLEL